MIRVKVLISVFFIVFSFYIFFNDPLPRVNGWGEVKNNIQKTEIFCIKYRSYSSLLETH